MRASPEPVSILLAAVLLVVSALAHPAAADTAAADTADVPSFEATTRLDALERATRGQGPQTCFTRQEALAIETQRVYAELLVSALACERSYGLEDGYEAYVLFSERHQGLLIETQGTLERYLGSQAAFDSYSTRLANEQTQALSDHGTTRYCNIHRSRFGSLIAAEPGSVRDYMEELAGRLLSRQRGC